MAVRHIKEYFNTVANEYWMMLKEVEDFEKEAQKGLCDPDKIETLKTMTQPIKDNYLTLSYVMYLLNMPNKEKKKKKYEEMNEKVLKSIPHKNTEQGIHEENNKYLEEIKRLNG